jgi:hypothetical protein
MVELDRLTPSVLQDWLATAVTSSSHGTNRVSSGVDLDGLRAVPALAAQLVKGLDRAA